MRKGRVILVVGFVAASAFGVIGALMESGREGSGDD